MFGEFFVFPTLSHFATLHACSCGDSLVGFLVLWPIRYHSIGVSYGIPRFSSSGSYFSHPAVVRSTPRTCHLRLTNFTGSLLIVPSSLHHLTQRRRIRQLNGPTLLTSIPMHSSHFILPFMLRNFSSSLSSWRRIGYVYGLEIHFIWSREFLYIPPSLVRSPN
jgi:hypothetical protein